MNKNVYAPVKGKVINITEVNDPVFSEKMIGDGIAIMPCDEYICSPIDGTIESIFPTNHAFIVKSEENHQILVHIGLDTVELNGKPFKRLIKNQSKVHAGDAIIKSNYKMIQDKGFDPIVIVVLSDEKISSKTNLKSIDSLDDVLFTIE